MKNAQPSYATLPATVPPPSAAQQLAGITQLELDVLYAQCAGKPELAVRVLQQLLTHYRNAGAALLDHLQAGEFEELGRKVHSMRGAMAAVGAGRVLEQVQRLESLLRAEASMPDVLPPARVLRAELDALIAELDQHLAV